MCPGQLMTSLTCNHSTSQIAQSKYKIKIIQNNYRDREEDRKRGKTKVIQVCLQLPTSANNVTLLAFVVDRQLLMQQLINITCLLVQQSIDGTDRVTQTLPPTTQAVSIMQETYFVNLNWTLFNSFRLWPVNFALCCLL